jgi:hypothetical protein
MSINSITLDAHLAQAGPAAEGFERLWRTIWRQTHVSPEHLELCRLMFARLHHDGEELAAINANIAHGLVADEKRAIVVSGRALDSDAFNDAERAVLLFAEYYWLDVQSITDEAADDVKRHFGEPGLVFLIEALGLIDGRIRAARCLRDLKANVFAKGTPHVH